MTSSHISRSADVREAVGHQIRHYRLARQQAAADQRQTLAAQAAQLHDVVANALADLDADHAASAESQRIYLSTTISALRDDVADLLQSLSDDRRARAADRQSQRAYELRDLRQQVANYLDDLSANRAARAAEQAAALASGRQARVDDVADMLMDLRASRPADSSPTPASLDMAEHEGDMVQRLGQAGLVAYAQMARVTILRALEGGATSDAQERQISAQIDGLVGNVQPFLADAMRAIERLSPADRDQLLEIVSGVQRNVTLLSHELESAPWPTTPAHRQSFRRLVEDLRHRLVPVVGALEEAEHALQGTERPRAGRRHAPAEPAAEGPQARSYRDNLTTIHGIGPALQQRLDRAGICTYIQLALSSPEELRKALGESGRLANVEDWIVQARSLAGMPS
ncbi:hypothetical protein K2Z83_28055 [Oscillochloris sp. ZM17-4]|uniref:hypothetical protein n=1 Tax=Oscillochloris sp. ZM17-4 TaxID=2866714 RepID=UPI001C7340C3|nr:hypothetical protein [Oscillochloris sp. ZM17-4]MBX0331512.1 hypothetical protein [Oscillochloris sp. ZM17-4]